MGGFLPGLGGSGEPSTGGGGGVRAARLGSQKEETCRPGTLGAPRPPYCSCLSPWGFLQETGGGGKRGGCRCRASTSLVCDQPDLLSPHQEVTVTGSLGGWAGWGSWPREGGPGLTIGGMAAARCFSCFRSSGFWGEAWVLASLVGVRRLGRGDRSLAVGGHGGDGETSVRPTGSQASPGSCLDDVARGRAGAARGR